jgi:HD-GYP domain-containing protein (c-di-GMP phosphodiesterase class II)
MSDTQALLEKISALRRRLELVQGLVAEAGSTAASLVPAAPDPTGRVRILESQLKAGHQHDNLLDNTLRPLMETTESVPLPNQLTSRARRLLERGRQLLDRLRSLGHQLDPVPEADPLAEWYRATVAMTDSALRMIGTFPDAPSVQLRLCEGIEATLATIAQRLARLDVLIDRRRQEIGQVETLAGLFADLEAGRRVDIQPFVNLAEALLDEAEAGAPLRLTHAGPEEVCRFVAGHSLNVARVAARVMRHDPELSRQPLEPILAALIHDAGMVKVPVDILTHPGPLTDMQRRTIEGHPHRGAEWAARLLRGTPWLSEATADHHERLDGTGYPSGLRDKQIGPLARLLAVCDIYAALCSPRPQRPARETRTALADTLLLAEEGGLDRYHAERLLVLSFYPAGTVVELADGATAVVVATPAGRGDLNAPARPVVALLTDSQGRPLPFPQYLDLAQCEGHGIVRSLPAAERSQVLGCQYPEFV